MSAPVHRSDPAWKLTPHAIRRYCERIEPGASRSTALRYLKAAARRAVFTGFRGASSTFRDPEAMLRAEFIVRDGALVTVTDPAQRRGVRKAAR